MSYYLDLQLLTDTASLKKDWESLQEVSDCSYFQSWGWVGTWLEKVVNDIPCEVIRVRDNGELVAIGILVKIVVRKLGRPNTRILFLNEAPSRNRNMVIEYNGLLVKRGLEETVYKEVIYHLRYSSDDWDEIHLGMIRKSITDTFIDQLDNEFFLVIDKESQSWQFDSAGIEQGLDGVYSSLSRNRRTQIKKAFKRYQVHSEIKLEVAKNQEEAQAFFDGLKFFHTQRWEAAGKGGSFSNELWEQYHRALIFNRFDKNEIQLLKISNSEVVIGYVYNFIWRDRVYVLQTGFNMSAVENGQPGYVSHIKAILYNQSKGNKIYDLLCEDSGYKSILCNRTENLVSVSFKRIALKSMMRQLSLSNIKCGYVAKVIRATLVDKLNIYRVSAMDRVYENWVRVTKKWPCYDKKYLLVGAESSGTTAISDLLFKEKKNVRYLEEGDEQWVWEAYREIYQGRAQVKDYPGLQLFDAIKVPGFSMIIEKFREQFPNTTVIYLMRDPRDFASSAIKTWNIGSMENYQKIPWTDIAWLNKDSESPVERLALRWQSYVRAAAAVKDVHYIKYEDFCSNKVDVIEELCDTLQLSFDRNRVEKLCDIQLSHGSVRSYKPSGPGAWRNSILEKEHILAIEKICHKEMKTWGYKLSTEGG